MPPEPAGWKPALHAIGGSGYPARIQNWGRKPSMNRVECESSRATISAAWRSGLDGVSPHRSWFQCALKKRRTPHGPVAADVSRRGFPVPKQKECADSRRRLRVRGSKRDIFRGNLSPLVPRGERECQDLNDGGGVKIRFKSSGKSEKTCF